MKCSSKITDLFCRTSCGGAARGSGCVRDSGSHWMWSAPCGLQMWLCFLNNYQYQIFHKRETSPKPPVHKAAKLLEIKVDQNKKYQNQFLGIKSIQRQEISMFD